MSTVRRRRLAATALATTALLALGGCGTGFSAQTNQVYQAGVGANHRGEIDVLNTLFVANEDGSATLSAAIVNNTRGRADAVVRHGHDPRRQGSSRSQPKLRCPLPRACSPRSAARHDAGGFLISKGATAGDYVKVTLTFEHAAPVTIEAPVVTRTAEYAEVASAPEPEPTPTPTETESTEDSAE